MKRALLKITLAFSLMMLSLPSVVCAGYISIDSFDTGSMVLTARNPLKPTAAGYDDSVDANATLWGMRRAVLSAFTPTNQISGLYVNYNGVSPVSPGLQLYSLGTSLSSAWLVYDAVPYGSKNPTIADPFGGSPSNFKYDFTEVVGANGSLELDNITVNTSSPVNVALYFRDNDSWAKVDTTLTTTNQLLINFSNWSNQGIDFAQITGFSMFIEGLTGGSLSIGSIGASGSGPAPVPEPSTYLLMGIGLLGAVVLRRRSKV